MKTATAAAAAGGGAAAAGATISICTIKRDGPPFRPLSPLDSRRRKKEGVVFFVSV